MKKHLSIIVGLLAASLASSHASAQEEIPVPASPKTVPADQGFGQNQIDVWQVNTQSRFGIFGGS